MASRIAILAVALMLASVGFVAVAVFLCMSLYSGFSLVLSPPLAALASAGVILLISLLIVLIGSAMARAAARSAQRARARSGRPPAAQLGGEIGRLVGENAFKFVTDSPVRVLIGAVIAGFAVGAFPKLRSFLKGILK